MVIDAYPVALQWPRCLHLRHRTHSGYIVSPLSRIQRDCSGMVDTGGSLQSQEVLPIAADWKMGFYEICEDSDSNISIMSSHFFKTKIDTLLELIEKSCELVMTLVLS